MVDCSPQCEDGYTKIANELLEALSSARMSGRQWQIILLIIRNTYGFQRKEWKTSNQEIANSLNMHRQHTSNELKVLHERKIIFVTENGYERKVTIGIQKKYNKWSSSPKSVTVTENGYDSSRKTVTVPLKKKEILNMSFVTENGYEKKRKHSLPKNFPLSEKLRNFAIEKNIPSQEIEELFSAFCDHFWNNGKTGLDWDRAWYNWVRNEVRWNPKKYQVVENNSVKYLPPT
jgi:phage replication O-like protein O